MSIYSYSVWELWIAFVAVNEIVLRQQSKFTLPYRLVGFYKVVRDSVLVNVNFRTPSSRLSVWEGFQSHFWALLPATSKNSVSAGILTEFKTKQNYCSPPVQNCNLG